jgi:hypothetical protein
LTVSWDQTSVTLPGVRITCILAALEVPSDGVPWTPPEQAVAPAAVLAIAALGARSSAVPVQHDGA